MSGPRNATVTDGQTARLDCDVDGFPDNVSVDWLHVDTGGLLAGSTAAGGGGSHVDGTTRHHLVDPTTSSLTLVNVTTQDAGTYTCSAYNARGASADASAYLNVTCTIRYDAI